MGKLDGKVAFVTGAARGQGRSHAIHLAQEGADIIAIDLCDQVESVQYPMSTIEDLDETARLVEKEGQRIIASRADIRDPDGLKAVVDAGVAELGRLDVIIANAGICTVHAHDVMTPAVWKDMIDVNLTGVFNTMYASLSHVIAGGNGGSVVITSSCTTLRTVQGLSHYVAAKSGVDGYMRSLALELAPQSIRVNTIHPTHVDTGMIQNEPMRRLFLPDVEHPTREESMPVYQSTNALPVSWVDPEDISRAMIYFATDDSRYVTGAKLAVDAGFSLI
jgi:(+)-trans-carveol dehydrogenase